MTSWRDITNGGKGTYKGITFLVESISIEGGRRTATYEFNGSNQIRSDDFGRRARRFAVVALLIGDNHHTERDDLIAALETKGAGDFEYPLVPRVSCILDGFYRLTESTSSANATRIEFSLKESGLALQPQKTNASDALVVASSATKSKLKNAMTKAIIVAGKTGRVLNRGIQSINQAASCINRINKKAQSAFSFFSKTSQAIENLGTSASTLIRTPATLFDEIDKTISAAVRTVEEFDLATQDTVRALSGEGPAAIGRTASRFRFKAFSAMSYSGNLFGDNSRKEEHAAFFGSPPLEIKGDGASAQQSRVNNDAIIQAVKGILAIEIATASLALDFDSSEDALAMRDDLLSLLDASQATSDDELYDAIAGFKASLAEHFRDVARSLPTFDTYTTTSVTSSLAVAYQMDGTIDYDSDITLANNLPNPAAIPAYTTLKVIRRGTA